MLIEGLQLGLKNDLQGQIIRRASRAEKAQDLFYDFEIEASKLGIWTCFFQDVEGCVEVNMLINEGYDVEPALQAIEDIFKGWDDMTVSVSRAHYL
jgi:hypothetical protein